MQKVGHLEKLGGVPFLKRWQERYFKLNDDMFEWYENENVWF